MPQIIPIKELKNTAAVSELCHSTTEPIFITKNGYGDMVLMSMEAYEEAFLKLKLYQELEISEQQIQEGKVMDAKDSLARLKAKYEL
ncbi:type II toxin-antitoxin system Phd/YefM family antitoxin [Zhenpiania hominis]|uniref:type II toxin-antitoxin system Phd/YefM family antitoxin n=1 Tax=Zhenpiania hominis TaxID=2763644 RepID=UPI0039F551E6